MTMKTKLFIACDYRGHDLKEQLLNNDSFNKHFDLVDLGIERGSRLDYIDISKTLAESIKLEPDAFGVMICGSGHGVAMALNRFNHIRAATCNNIIDAETVKEKLNANVICMGNKHVDCELAIEIILSFKKTIFRSQKHSECVNKLFSNQTAHHKNGVNLIVRAIIEFQDHILLTTATLENKNFDQGLFFLPGGHVEHNEPSLVALKREIFEEMGLETKDERFVGSLECSWDRKGSIYHEIDVIYKVNIDNLNLEKPPIALDHNFHQFVWKKIDEVQDLVILPHSLKTIIANRNTQERMFLSEMIT